VSQDISGQAQVAETATQETKTFIRQVRTKTRRKYAPEDKIRIVMEGFRREVTVSDLCRREGIKPGVFYAGTSVAVRCSVCVGLRSELSPPFS